MDDGQWGRRIEQKQRGLSRFCSNRGWFRWLLGALFGLLFVIAVHTGMAAATDTINAWLKAEPQAQSIPARPQPSQTSVTVLPELMQQAEEHYQAGRISDAIALWQQAANAYEKVGDRLHQALVLSYLATALNDTGQWMKAKDAIHQSISLLQVEKAAPNSNIALSLAQVLTTHGELQLAQGNATEALATWQRAEAVYRQLNDTNGVLGSQINQSRALQADGLYRRATELLTEVDRALQKQLDSPLKVVGLRNLGKMLRLVGDLSRSQAVLEQSLAIAQKLQDPKTTSAISGILFSLGNTTRAQGDLEAAFNFYQKAIASAPSLMAKTQVQLAQLSVLIDSDRLPEARVLLPQIQSQIAQLPLHHLTVYAQVDLARSLIKLSRRGDKTAASTPFLGASAQALATAVQYVHALGDRRAESYALGTLGSLYEVTQQWHDAKTLTQQALSLAQAIDADDIAYQWHWQLGRIFCQGTQPCTPTGQQQATIAYAEAVKTLQSLRSDLAAINSDVQFSFREEVEPVYRQYVELLLQSNANDPGQENLIQARETIEALQLAELDNFFREACITARSVKIDQVDPHAAVVYPIILPNQFTVILSLPNQPLRYHTTQRSQAEVEGTLVQMRQALRPTAFIEDWLPLSQQVYNLILRPLEHEIAAGGIKTLVFVPDGLLRGLPMAALHDGQRYLVEKYGVVLTPGLQLLQPQPLDRQRLKGLLAGLTQARDQFAALPNVAVEINQIEAEIPAQVLLDQAFTNQAFQDQINSTPSPVVHLATHGQFSSNAENTFIVTWDGRINVKQLDQLLRFREGRLNPIELLVLSACQTATGDKRAALGIAGVAVRSGARSTLASLWSVSDRSTAALMIEFYRELGKTGVTKAEALRRAQVALLQQTDYTSPYFWAPFVLLGNWL